MDAGQTLEGKQENLRTSTWLEQMSLSVFSQYDCNLLLWLYFTARFPTHTQTKYFKYYMECFSPANSWESIQQRQISVIQILP